MTQSLGVNNHDDAAGWHIELFIFQIRRCYGMTCSTFSKNYRINSSGMGRLPLALPKAFYEKCR